MIIEKISARKMKDSRGKDTIEVSINGISASSPSGTSAGKYEAKSFHKDVFWNVKAINNFKELKEINLESFADLHLVEDLIMKKFNLKKANQFGANALFALESAILKAIAKEKKKELWQIINENAKRMPVPLGNVLGGGLHTKNNDSPTFQEFLIVPKGKSIKENFEIMKRVHNKLGKLTKSKTKGQEGEWETPLNEEQILKILSKFKDVRIGLDVAASTFYKNKEYHYKNKTLDKKAQIKYINYIIEDFNPIYVEDPLDEEDFAGFSKISKKTLVSGDDLTVSNLERVKKAYKMKSINCMILKPNQTGSLIEINEVVKFCKHHGIKTVFSHRAGETLDNALADYAFGFQSDFIKCGISTKWREVKLKRLIDIAKSIR
jgi:enolase